MKRKELSLIRDFADKLEESPLRLLLIDLLDTIDSLREAHERTVEVVEEMLNRFTTEAVANPTRQDGHYAMVQLLHCYKRSQNALKKLNEGEK